MLIELYYIESNKSNDPPLYYRGTTFYNSAEWIETKENSFFFNQEPRKYQIIEILKNTPINFDISLKDIKIKKLTVNITSEEIIEVL